MEDLNQLLKKLLETDLDFVVVGGFASALHGASQLTRDIDLCVALDPRAIETLRRVLKDTNPRIRAHPKKLSFLEDPSDLTNVRNLYLETDMGAVDLLSEIKGVGDFARVASKAASYRLFGKDCRVIGLEDLIQAKRAMGRDKDVAAAIELEAILEKRRPWRA